MDESRRCKAKSKHTGERCKRPALLGQQVCRMHGGASPQAKRKAAERIADLIDPDRALREAARIAYSDLRGIVGSNGALKPVSEWPDDLVAAVAGVEVVQRNLVAGDGMQEYVHKIKLWDKPKALEMLFKHLGLLTEKVEMEHSGGVVLKWKD